MKNEVYELVTKRILDMLAAARSTGKHKIPIAALTRCCWTLANTPHSNRYRKQAEESSGERRRKLWCFGSGWS